MYYICCLRRSQSAKVHRLRCATFSFPIRLEICRHVGTERSRSSSPRQQQEETGDGDRVIKLDNSKKEKQKDKDKGKDTSTKSRTSSSSRGKKPPSRIFEGEAAAAAPSSLLPPPPPPTAPAAPAPPAAPAVFAEALAQNQRLTANTTQGGGAGLQAEWHLCHDDEGNAYYYSETTGKAGVYFSMGEEVGRASPGRNYEERAKKYVKNTGNKRQHIGGGGISVVVILHPTCEHDPVSTPRKTYKILPQP